MKKDSSNWKVLTPSQQSLIKSKPQSINFSFYLIFNFSKRILLLTFKKVRKIKEDVINNICSKFFQFLTKMVINAHLWDDPLDVEVKLQKLKIKNKLSSTRLMILDTFYYILKCNSEQNMEVKNVINLMESVNVTTWHVFIKWFFRYKTNNLL